MQHSTPNPRLDDLSVVVPSYNGRDVLAQTLQMLLRAAPEAEIVVVDGSSPDGSAEMVRERFPQAHLHVYPNHGFAHAINRGIEHCSRRFVLLLNSDVFVSKVTLTAMMQRLADARVGAVAPGLRNLDGTRQRVFGTFYWPNWRDVQKPSPMRVLSAACLMTRRDVLERLGGLDENLFLYNEELDWCARARGRLRARDLAPDSAARGGSVDEQQAGPGAAPRDAARLPLRS